jgi:hypothetical protein
MSLFIEMEKSILKSFGSTKDNQREFEQKEQCWKYNT